MRQPLNQSFKSSSTVPDLFVSTAREKEFVKNLHDLVKDVVQSCYPDMDAFVEKVEAMGLPVLMNGPELRLKFSIMIMGTEPGFIAPTLPKYAEFVESLKKAFPHKAHLDYSQGVLLTIKEFNHYSFLAYQFYHWMAYKNGLGGYDNRARQLYSLFAKKYQGKLHPKLLEDLDYEETSQLKLAIRRDKEALQFVRNVVNEVFIPGNNARLLEAGKAQA